MEVPSHVRKCCCHEMYCFKQQDKDLENSAHMTNNNNCFVTEAQADAIPHKSVFGTCYMIFKFTFFIVSAAVRVTDAFLFYGANKCLNTRCTWFPFVVEIQNFHLHFSSQLRKLPCNAIYTAVLSFRAVAVKSMVPNGEIV